LASSAITSANQSKTSNLDVTFVVWAPPSSLITTACPGDRAQFTNGSSVVIEEPLALKRRSGSIRRTTGGQAAHQIRTSSQVRVQEEDPSDDFSQEEASVFSEAAQAEFAEANGRRAPVSSPWLRQVPGFVSTVSVMAQSKPSTTSTEGTQLQHGRSCAGCYLGCRTSCAG
jgi:hypothetical protein